MSLLMKALASAEKDNKLAQGQSSSASNEAMLELESLDPLTGPDTQQAKAKVQQQAAANIFNAAQSSQSHFSKAIIGLLLIITACILWFGFQLLTLNANDAEVLLAQEKPYVNEATSAPNPVNSVIAHQLEAAPNQPAVTEVQPAPQAKPTAPIATQQTIKPVAQSTKQTQAAVFQAAQTIIGDTSEPIEKPYMGNEALAATLQTRRLASDNPLPAKRVTQSSPIKVVSQKQKPSVDQTLLDAYDAYTKGNDATAKALYRQMLQKDIRQVDALLGMAVIAQRQSRSADAVGWYQKVLEIDPRNPTAMAGIASAHPETNRISQISRLKNLIAQNPKTANYHAALGNLYANKSQWPLAQQAYFEANRYDSNNAEYAFNLAISLEHLGKAKLASTHYQRALRLVTQSGASTPNRVKIEERLNALQ